MHFDELVVDRTGLQELDSGGGGRFRVGSDGVLALVSPLDGKSEFICYEDKTICYVKSAMGYPAMYPVEPVKIEHPVKAILMDLDGTSVRSEGFWVRVIEMSTCRLLDNPDFKLEESDLPHVSGHSVSEHLQHCIAKYCPDKTVEEARRHYFDITREQMKLISEGRGWKDAFEPAPGLKDFLLAVKAKGMKIGLVTSGLYEKAWPEILSAFRTLGMGDPKEFYDAIITAGFTLGQGEPGTLGELSPKPHPWLYAETCRVGLGIDYSERHRVVGLEDSGAGVISIRLAGFAVIGVADGNIPGSGTLGFCTHYCESLPEALEKLRGQDNV